MNVRVKSIDINNFKGIQKLYFSFNEGSNTISGDNGTGKTTLADAFFWCLYEKDTQGRTDFDIKRLDTDGNIIMRESHSVTVTLDADGEIIKLTRRLEEDWTRRRGDSEETFKGNHVDREWNGVPMTKMEFDMKLSEIASEEVMKLTILPLYFLNQKKDYQRDFLVKMAGEITPEMIIAEHPEWEWIINDMKSMTIDEMCKMLGAQIKTHKKNIDTIPARIDENNRNMPCEENWEELEHQLSDAIDKLQSIEHQLADKAEAYNAQAEQKNLLGKQLAEASSAVSNRQLEIQKENSGSYIEQSKLQTQLKSEHVHLQALIISNNNRIESAEKDIKDLETERALKLHQYREVQTETFCLPEGSLVCPTCGQELPIDKADEKREELLKNWNLSHADRLNKIVNEGKGIKNTIENKQSEIAKIQDETTKLNMRKTEIENNPLFTAEIKQDLTNEEDPVLVRLKEEENALRIKYNSYELKAPDDSYLKSQKSTINIDINNIQIKLATRNRIAEISKRNEELEEERNSTLNMIAEVEGKLYQIDAYKKAYMTAVENKVNSLFSIVKWRMYEPQINGGEKETCIALVNGVPYGRSLNTAACINAGVDIINTIGKYYNVISPIFVDNRETVVNLIDTSAQTINLVVDANFKQLTKTV